MLEVTISKPGFKGVEAIYKTSFVGLLEPNDVSGAALRPCGEEEDEPWAPGETAIYFSDFLSSSLSLLGCSLALA